MKKLLFALFAALSAAAFAQQDLPNLVVDVNGQPAELKPVMLELNEYLVPLRDTVALLTAGKAQLVADGKVFNINIDNRTLIKIPKEGGGKDALIYGPSGDEPVRKLSMEDFPHEVNAKGRGPTTMVDLDLLAACLGATVDIDGKRMSLYTTDYWCKKLGISAERTQDRLTKGLGLLPDFGVSPPAKTLLFWIRPPVETYIQAFRINDNDPEPMLGVNAIEDEVDILTPNDRAKVRQADEAEPVRAETYNYGDQVGKVATYVAVVLKKDIGFTNPIEAINSGAVGDDWAVIGIRQRVGRMPVLFENREVQAGEDIGAFATRNKTTPSVIKSINGLRTGEKLKPKSKLAVIVGLDENAIRLMQAAPFKITGLYEVQPGETISDLAKAWGVSEEEILAANTTIPPGGEPEAGDLINAIAKDAPVSNPSNPNPQPNPAVAKNETVSFMGTAVATADIALKDNSTPGSSVVGNVKKNAFLELVGYMPAQQMYRVRIDGGIIGYAPASALRLRPGSGGPTVVAANINPSNNPVANEALKYLGTPYVWGGNGLTTGIDCSHFVAQVYKRIGWPEPPAPVTTQETIGDIVHYKPGAARRAGRTIILPNPVVAPRASPDIRTLRPGDRIIFQRGNTDASGSRHTAVYIGRVPPAWQARFGDLPWAFVHASSSRGVTVNSLTQKYYWGLYKFSCRSAGRGNTAMSADDAFAQAMLGGGK